jgi:hypothetical protein
MPIFNETLRNYTISSFNNKFARSLYVALKCTNSHIKAKYIIPKEVKPIIQRLYSIYKYIIVFSNEEIAKLATSEFFDHLIKFFDNKVKNYANRNFLNEIFSFLKVDKKLDIDQFKSFEENFDKLKLVTYSGHDGNLISLIRNLFDEKQLLSFFLDFSKYKNLLYFDFGSTIDFQLIQTNNHDFYVKLFINGSELNKLITIDHYDINNSKSRLRYFKELGVPYNEFRSFILERKFPQYDQCIFPAN